MRLKKKSWAAFRVDGDSTIGTGHVLRCLSLAGAAQACGLDTRFLTRSLDERLLPRIAAAQVKLCYLPESQARCDGPYAHSDWLAASEAQDAADCQAKLTELGKLHGLPTFVAVDHYALAAPWHKKLKAVAPVLAIDELIDRPLAPDWLVDPTAGKTTHDYADMVPASTHCLIGGQYALLRPEFSAQAESLQKKRPPVRLPLRVLITMGGVDSSNASATALDALKIVARELPVEATLLIGNSNPNIARLRHLTASTEIPIRLLVDSNEIAKLMVSHHLAIGAAGTSALERCAMGLPALNLILAQNQAGTCSWLDETGAALNMGWASDLTPDKLAKKILLLAQNQDLYSQMSLAAFAVTDGHGCKRIMGAILRQG